MNMENVPSRITTDAEKAPQSGLHGWDKVRQDLKDGLVGSGKSEKEAEAVLQASFDNEGNNDDDLNRIAQNIKRGLERGDYGKNGENEEREPQAAVEEDAADASDSSLEKRSIEVPPNLQALKLEDFRDLLDAEEGKGIEELVSFIEERQKEIARIYKNKGLKVSDIKALEMDGGPLEGLMWQKYASNRNDLKKYLLNIELGSSDTSDVVRNSRHQQWVEFFEHSDTIIERLDAYTPAKTEKENKEQRELGLDDARFIAGLREQVATLDSDLKAEGAGLWLATTKEYPEYLKLKNSFLTQLSDAEHKELTPQESKELNALLADLKAAKAAIVALKKKQPQASATPQPANDNEKSLVLTKENEISPQYEDAYEAWKNARAESNEAESAYQEALKEFHQKSRSYRWFGIRPKHTKELAEENAKTLATRKAYHEAAKKLIAEKYATSAKSPEEIEKITKRYAGMLGHTLLKGRLDKRMEAAKAALAPEQTSKFRSVMRKFMKSPKWLRMAGFATLGSGIALATGGVSTGADFARRLVGFGLGAGVGIAAGKGIYETVKGGYRKAITEREGKLQTSLQEGKRSLFEAELEDIEVSVENDFNELERKKLQRDRVAKGASAVGAAAAGYLAGRGAIDALEDVSTHVWGSGAHEPTTLRGEGVDIVDNVHNNTGDFSLEDATVPRESLAGDIDRTVNEALPRESLARGIDNTVAEGLPYEERGGSMDRLIDEAVASQEYVVKGGDNLWNILEGDVEGRKMSEVLKSIPESERNNALSTLFKEVDADAALREEIGMKSLEAKSIFPGEKLNIGALEARLSEIIQEGRHLSTGETSASIPSSGEVVTQPEGGAEGIGTNPEGENVGTYEAAPKEANNGITITVKEPTMGPAETHDPVRMAAEAEGGTYEPWKREVTIPTEAPTTVAELEAAAEAKQAIINTVEAPKRGLFSFFGGETSPDITGTFDQIKHLKLSEMIDLETGDSYAKSNRLAVLGITEEGWNKWIETVNKLDVQVPAEKELTLEAYIDTVASRNGDQGVNI